jgi:hypothetical protein
MAQPKGFNSKKAQFLLPFDLYRGEPVRSRLSIGKFPFFNNIVHFHSYTRNICACEEVRKLQGPVACVSGTHEDFYPCQHLLSRHPSILD